MNDESKEILFFALSSGEMMLCNGGEIYRVEDMILRICHSRNIEDINVFATPTIVMISSNKIDRFCIFKRILHRNTDLEKVSMINDLARKFTSTDMSAKSANKRLEDISNKNYNKILKFIFAGISAACISTLFGGDLKDFVATFFIGLVAEFCYETSNSFSNTPFLSNILAGVVIGTMASVFTKYVNTSLDTTIIGSLMPFVPGVVLTNSVRDFIYGDLLSGSSRFFEAIIIAASIAFGVASAISLIGKIL